MKLINPKVEIIPQEEGIDGIYKQIEIAGRTCYKSEDKITPTSAKEFVDRMITNGHTAMLEHGTVYLCIPVEDWEEDAHEWEFMFPEGCPWVKVNSDSRYVYITTNFRHIIEGEVGIELMKTYWSAPTEYHEKRVTVRFTCDRGVSHELVRHRVFSFAQESTRYCNYSKDKFGNELTFITPDKENWKGLYAYYQMLNCLDEIEGIYMGALKEGVAPQTARAILPNCLKTEVVMTGFLDDWQHFFELRCAPSAHPDMQVLANQLNEQFIQNKYIEDYA